MTISDANKSIGDNETIRCGRSNDRDGRIDGDMGISYRLCENWCNDHMIVLEGYQILTYVGLRYHSLDPAGAGWTKHIPG